MALTTVADLKTYLGIVGTSEDAFLAQLLAGVEAAIQNMLTMQIAQATYTEYYCGYGTDAIWLRELPVQSITSLYLSSSGYWGQGSFASDTLLTAGTDYYLEKDGVGGAYSMSGIVRRIGRAWPAVAQYSRGRLTPNVAPGLGNIKVTYVGGFPTVPADIKLACWESCKALRASRHMPGFVTSEGLAENSFSVGGISEAELMRVGSVQQILANYRRFRIR